VNKHGGTLPILADPSSFIKHVISRSLSSTVRARRTENDMWLQLYVLNLDLDLDLDLDWIGLD